MMQRRSIGLAVALASALPAAAQAPGTVEAGVYKIDPEHTHVLFAISRFTFSPFGFTTYHGEFVGAAGTLTIDPANIAGSHLEVSIPISGLATSSRKLDTELEGPLWFDAARFPAMTFRSTSVTRTGPDSADVVGDLTLHGVTRPVTFKTRFNLGAANSPTRASTAGFEATGRIRRDNFGVDRYALMVGNDVSLTITASFARAPK